MKLAHGADHGAHRELYPPDFCQEKTRPRRVRANAFDRIGSAMMWFSEQRAIHEYTIAWSERWLAFLFLALDSRACGQPSAPHASLTSFKHRPLQPKSLLSTAMPITTSAFATTRLT